MAQETSTEGGIAPVTLKTAPIMKSTLPVSLLVHLIILVGLQKAFPVEWVAKPLKTYHVELLRPPLDPLEDINSAATELAKIKPEQSTLPEETEDTISLETKDKRYRSYAKSIKARLTQHWQYPHEAWENLIEGDVLIIFSLDRQGHLKGLNILQPSQHDILDTETTRTIRDAAPFPPFPGSVIVKKLNIKANFAYRLTASK